MFPSSLGLAKIASLPPPSGFLPLFCPRALLFSVRLDGSAVQSPSLGLGSLVSLEYPGPVAHKHLLPTRGLPAVHITRHRMEAAWEVPRPKAAERVWRPESEVLRGILEGSRGEGRRQGSGSLTAKTKELKRWDSSPLSKPFTGGPEKVHMLLRSGCALP